MLEENGGELGGLLWRSLRAVHAWGATVPADRALLFCPDARDQRMADVLAAAPEPALERPLRVLAEMLGAPVEIDPERVALACLSIAGWARDAGKPATAREFAYAAVVACPGSPMYALATARLYRDQGCYDEAEVLYQRAITLARQVRDWESYARAYAGLGKLSQSRGGYPAARRFLLRASRAAERHHLRAIGPMVLHDLFTIEVECGHFGLAEQYAEAAAVGYGPGHEMLPVLSVDVAVLWMEQGRFVEALPVLKYALPLLRAEGQLLGLGTLARAAGGAGDVGAYEAAREKILAAAPTGPRRIDALQELAQGAVSLGRLEDAERAAREALALAVEAGEHWTVFRMEGLLDEIAGLHRVAASPQSAPSAGAAPTPRASVLSLSRTLERVLTATI